MSMLDSSITTTMAFASALVANLISNLYPVMGATYSGSPTTDLPGAILHNTSDPTTANIVTSFLPILLNRTWPNPVADLGPSDLQLSSLYDSVASADSYSVLSNSGPMDHHLMPAPVPPPLPLAPPNIHISSNSSLFPHATPPAAGKYPNNQYRYGNAQNQYPNRNSLFQYNTNQMLPDDNFNSWNRVFKLVLLSFVSTIGSMGSIFIISAITVIDTFQIRGNCYLVSLAFGHLLVTILVLPASAIAIMADVTENSDICHFQWILTLACLMVTVLSFMLMAADNYYGMNLLVTYQLCCTRFRIFVLLLLIWALAFLFPFLQNQNHYGPEFCSDKRDWKISLDYHPYVLGFLIFSTIVTIIYFTRSLFLYKAYRLQLETSSTPKFLLTDGYLLQSNSFVYLISLAMWLPLIVTMVIDPIKPVPQHYLNTVWYIALGNSCCYSYLYAATNRDFREAFNKLFYYCCCKSHVTFARKGIAMRRTIAGPETQSGLRVHIIPGLNIYAPRKDTSGGGGGSGSGSYGMTSTGHGGIAGGGGFGGSYHHHGQIKSSCDL